MKSNVGEGTIMDYPFPMRSSALLVGLCLIVGPACSGTSVERVESKIDYRALVMARAPHALGPGEFQVPRILEAEPEQVAIAASFVTAEEGGAHRLCLRSSISVLRHEAESIVLSVTDEERELLLFAGERAEPYSFGAVSLEECNRLRVANGDPPA